MKFERKTRSRTWPWMMAVGGVLAARWALRRARRVSLSGKNALVTGGSRGLGLEIARVLVERGVNVAIAARDMIELQHAVNQLTYYASECAGSEAPTVVGVTCDLEHEEEVEEMVRKARARLGPIDVLVNNAGSIEVGPLQTIEPGDLERAMRLHCFAPFRATLAVRGDMRVRGGGRIANVASIGGLLSLPHLLPYSASKFALVGLSQGLHAELASEGIVVSTIAPGLMRTGSPRNALFKGDHQAEYAWFALADSLPLLSMSARRAAVRIVSALEHGDAHVVLGLPARLAALANGLAPGLVTRLLSTANRALPDGTEPGVHKGFESESPLVPSALTALTQDAELRNNQR